MQQGVQALSVAAGMDVAATAMGGLLGENLNVDFDMEDVGFGGGASAEDARYAEKTCDLISCLKEAVDKVDYFDELRDPDAAEETM